MSVASKACALVFADIRLLGADERRVKAALAIAIKKELDALGLTQQSVAEGVFLTQPQISKIRSIMISEFQVAKLQDVLRYLGML
jgi:predicted XRE-type DNA-binding protein